jgi:ketosteroid isomerase-like protein
MMHAEFHPRRSRNAEAEIRAILEEEVAALREKSAQRILALRADDLISFDLAPPLRQSRSDVCSPERLQAWFSTWEGPIDVQLTDVRIETSDDIAFASALNRMRGRKRDGEKVDLWFRATACFRRIHGDWKIVHEHNSVPMKMDGSGLAATDEHP